jgi:hypothetical protein
MKNASRRGVLTPAIELWNFESLEGLPSPHFGSVSVILTLFQKWRCDTQVLVSRVWMSSSRSSKSGVVTLHNCANVIWSLKRLKTFFFCLDYFSFSKKFNYITKMQPSSILNQEILIGLATSWLPPFKTHLSSLWLTYYKRPRYLLTTTLQNTPLITMGNLLQVA